MNHPACNHHWVKDEGETGYVCLRCGDPFVPPSEPHPAILKRKAHKGTPVIMINTRASVPGKKIIWRNGAVDTIAK